MEKSLSQKLVNALREIDRPDAFCVHGSVPAVLPGLKIRGVGAISLPLSPAQAKAIKACCRQAPYGKGTETIVDTTVRNVWHLAPTRFSLTNPAWKDFLAEVIGIVQEEMGLQKEKLEARLYDLLLYEKGSFFLPHKDGEKHDRMVATLVIVLPSDHEGGELIVRHDGREEVVDFCGAGQNPFEIQIAAFYADCEHEVRPVRKGYRLCLIYNLTLAKAKKSIQAPRASENVDRVQAILAKWADDPNAGQLVVTLEHEYTEKGIQWDALKGADRATADVLAEAARRANCRAYLGLLTFHQMGSGYSSGDDYGYGGRWHTDDDEEDTGSGEYFMDEVIEEELFAAHCKDRAGKSMPFTELVLGQDDMLEPESLFEGEPREEFEGYTGNAGMTLDRWYRHAAIILWPEKGHFNVVCDQNTRAGVELLKPLCAKWRKAAIKKAPPLREECIALARAVIRHWRDNAYGHGINDQLGGTLFSCLIDLDDPTLIAAYLTDLTRKDVAIDPGKALVKYGLAKGWQTLAPPILAMTQATNAPSLPRNVRVFEQIALARPRKDDGWGWLCESLAHELVSALERIDQAKDITDWRLRNVKREAVLPGLVRGLIASGRSAELARLVKHMLANPGLYPLVNVQLRALKELKPWLDKGVKTPSDALAAWLTACRCQLEALTASQPQAPSDFRRPAAAKCKCADCQALNRFLDDPRESVFQFKAGQQRRSHVEQSIRQGPCDVDCKQDRKTSPQTLVCTKNTRSYKAALKKYHEDQRNLDLVLAIEARLPAWAGRHAIVRH
ncbi:MAG: 2OG-Fe(II) oxygenase [Planctomycetes bacterium]|nr:2OG-Fe(II) oxygenase [Planctomycetota bacterium]